MRKARIYLTDNWVLIKGHELGMDMITALKTQFDSPFFYKDTPDWATSIVRRFSLRRDELTHFWCVKASLRTDLVDKALLYSDVVFLYDLTKTSSNPLPWMKYESPAVPWSKRREEAVRRAREGRRVALDPKVRTTVSLPSQGKDKNGSLQEVEYTVFVPERNVWAPIDDESTLVRIRWERKDGTDVAHVDAAVHLLIAQEFGEPLTRYYVTKEGGVLHEIGWRDVAAVRQEIHTIREYQIDALEPSPLLTLERPPAHSEVGQIPTINGKPLVHNPVVTKFLAPSTSPPPPPRLMPSAPAPPSQSVMTFPERRPSEGANSADVSALAAQFKAAGDLIIAQAEGALTKALSGWEDAYKTVGRTPKGRWMFVPSGLRVRAGTQDTHPEEGSTEGSAVAAPGPRYAKRGVRKSSPRLPSGPKLSPQFKNLIRRLASKGLDAQGIHARLVASFEDVPPVGLILKELEQEESASR